MIQDVTIMAPAGSFEALSAALHAGAGAVYFGVDKLNMRTGTRHNFRVDHLPEIASRCRDAGAASCLTLNTVLFDEDLDQMRAIVDAVSRAGITAVIASDPVVMQYARANGVNVHISTQCNITNAEALAFYAQWADVAVLARELTLEQIARIHREIASRPITGPSGDPVTIEVFVHGALCMAVSGRCYLSLHSQNRSANRGACVQNCRRPYEVKDQLTGNELLVDNEYIMSASDLCTIAFLDNILSAGARVLKIEGRGRSPEYVDTAVRCYSEAVQAIHEGSFSSEQVKEWMRRLSEVYNRGFWQGYFMGKTIDAWSDTAGSKATRKKSFSGPCLNYYAKAGVASFKVQAGSLSVGDQVLVTGPTTGVLRFELKELRVDEVRVEQVQQGMEFTTPVPSKVRLSDKLYRYYWHTEELSPQG